MRVFAYPADKAGCGHYRVRKPAEALRALGHDVTVVESEQGLGQAMTRGGRVVELVDPPECDVVVLQRVATRQLVDSIPLLQARGTAVVVEIDDLCSAIPDGNRSRWGWDPVRSPDENWVNLADACAAADLVTVTTPLLEKEYGRRTPARVLPNCVPEAWLSVETPRHGLVAGWTGTLASHLGDLKASAGRIGPALDEAGAALRIVGDAEAARYFGASRAEGLGWLALGEGYEDAVAGFDVGLAPLADNKFNKAKSWIKVLEYSALGVPWVASSTPEYRRLRGGGRVAEYRADWARHLRDLLGSQELRAELAGAGRELASRWTFEARAGDWWAAWEAALASRRGRISA